MPDTTLNNKRIAKNTMFMYFRMLFLIGIQLFTVPIVLKNLGVVDYGIYHVVGGFVTLFSFMGNALSSGSQRFISYSLGKNDEKSLKIVFQTTLSIYIGIAILMFLILEIAGYWFLNNKMTIPPERLYSANIVLQLSIASFIVNLISIPYNATIVAHERMSIYAYVSVADGILRFLAAIALVYILTDKLVCYSVLLFLISLLIRLIYQIYCKKNFYECHGWRFTFNKKYGKDMLNYFSWNIVGSMANIFKTQGINIIGNLFFGPILNAAHSVAQQIAGVLSQFINNLYISTRPQMTKLYANANEDEMWQLTFRSAKLAFYLLMIISVPILIESDFLLHAWLKDVPDYTIEITRLMIISLLIETLVNQIIGVFQAENKIKKYQLFSSTILLLIVPISYIILKLNVGFELTPYIVSIGASFLFSISILYIAMKEIDLNVGAYIKNVVVRECIVFILVYVFVKFSITKIELSWIHLILTVLLSCFYSVLFVFLVGLDSEERQFVRKYLKKTYTNFMKK